MKRNAIVLSLGLLLAGCSHKDFFKQYEVTDAERVAYAEKNLGVKIDARHDWILTKNYSVKITADADLDNIREVMVLNGNPYEGVTYRLARLPLTNGGTGSVEFTAPLSCKVLYAACLTADNHCVARPFRPGSDTTVSFVDEDDVDETVAATRAALADEATKITGSWPMDNRILDLPGLQAEVQAFLPSGKDNRDQVAKVGRHKVHSNMWQNGAHIILNYIAGTRNNQDVHAGYRVSLRYNPNNYDPQTFLLVDDINPNSFYTYEAPYYLTPVSHLRFYDFGEATPKPWRYKFTDMHEVEFFAVNGTDNTAGDTTRTVVFKVNGHLFLACESDGNWDYNDKVFLLSGDHVKNSVPDAGVTPTPSTAQVWTYAWEDKDFGDYDMNDCVIEVQENAQDNTKIDVKLMAVGGARKLWLGFENKSAQSYKDYIPVFDKELHEVLGMKPGVMINTGRASAKPVTITVSKPAGFDFQTCSFVLGAMAAEDQQGIYESDYYAIHIATLGQDPHGIVIPGKWQWPTETTIITKAYPQFAEWAKDVTNTNVQNWYENPVSGNVMRVE